MHRVRNLLASPLSLFPKLETTPINFERYCRCAVYDTYEISPESYQAI